jgi:hypothetical protein
MYNFDEVSGLHTNNVKKNLEAGYKPQVANVGPRGLLGYSFDGLNKNNGRTSFYGNRFGQLRQEKAKEEPVNLPKKQEPPKSLFDQTKDAYMEKYNSLRDKFDWEKSKYNMDKEMDNWNAILKHYSHGPELGGYAGEKYFTNKVISPQKSPTQSQRPSGNFWDRLGQGLIRGANSRRGTSKGLRQYGFNI